MNKQSVWTRMGRWLKRSRSDQGDSGTGPSEEPSNGQEHPSAESAMTHPAPAAASPEESAAGSRFRLSRSSPALERLEEEYKRVVKLVDAVQEHMSSQSERTEAMTRSLERLAESLSALPDYQRKQNEVLSKILAAVEADAAATKRVEDGLLQLPQIADAQRETMVSLGRQLDMCRQTDERVAGSMDGFRQAVNNLAGVTETSMKRLQDIRADALDRENRLSALMREQTKRLTVFAWCAMAFAAIASIIGIVALFR